MAFLELTFDAQDFLDSGFNSRDEIEDPVDDALREASLGEVTGGGTGLGITNIDIEIDDDDQLESAVTKILQVLQSIGAPPSTSITCYSPNKRTWTLLGEE